MGLAEPPALRISNRKPASRKASKGSVKLPYKMTKGPPLLESPEEQGSEREMLE